MMIDCLTPLTNNISKRPRRITVLMSALVIATSPLALADVQDASSGQFGGLYKVTSSTDPMFPATQTDEYFLDFGRGITADKTSGSVSISLRRNPNVQVRVMAWQYFPEQGKILIGNTYAKGSRNAVARGVWSMRGVSNGVIFERGSYQIILQPADPNDY